MFLSRKSKQYQFCSYHNGRISRCRIKIKSIGIKNEIDLQELQNEYFIYYSKQSGLRPLIDDLFHSNNIEPNIMFEVEEDSAILGLVDINYGVAVVPNIPMIDHFHLKKLKSRTHKRNVLFIWLQ